MFFRNIVRPLAIALVATTFIIGGCAVEEGESNPDDTDNTECEQDCESEEDSGESDDGETDGEDDGWGEDDEETPSGKDAGEVCDSNSECNSGICFETSDANDTKKCTIECNFGGGQCDAMGWACAEINGGSQYLCVE